jgi:hypothetical protein
MKKFIFHLNLLVIILLFLTFFQCTKEEPKEMTPLGTVDPRILKAQEYWASNQLFERSDDGLQLDWDAARVRFNDSIPFVTVPVIELSDTIDLDLVFYSDSCGLSEEIWAYHVGNTFTPSFKDQITDGIVLVVNDCQRNALIFSIQDTTNLEYLRLDFEQLIRVDSIIGQTSDRSLERIDWIDRLNDAINSTNFGGRGPQGSGGGGGTGGGTGSGSGGGWSGGWSGGNPGGWSGGGGWSGANDGGNVAPVYDPLANHPLGNNNNTNINQAAVLQANAAFLAKFGINLLENPNPDLVAIANDSWVDGESSNTSKQAMIERAAIGVLNYYCHFTAAESLFLSNHSEIASNLLLYLVSNNYSQGAINTLNLQISIFEVNPGLFTDFTTLGSPVIGTNTWVASMSNVFLGIFQQNPVGQWQKLKAAEKQFAKDYPFAFLEIVKNTSNARARQLALYGSNNPNVTWLGMGDAFLHTYWQGLNASVLGHDLAKQFGDAHESEHPQVLHLETEMDFWNNWQGYAIGVANPCSYSFLGNPVVPEAQIEAAVLMAIQNGQCRYLSPVDHALSPAYNEKETPINPKKMNGILITTIHEVPESTLLKPTNQ